MKQIPAAKFKAQCLALLDRVDDEGIVITKRGKPVAKLAPCDDTPADAFGILAGSVLGHDDIVSPDPDAWSEHA